MTVPSPSEATERTRSMPWIPESASSTRRQIPVETARSLEADSMLAADTGRPTGAALGVPLPIESMAARLIRQYPQTLPIFALFGAMDAFLYAYGAVHLLYVGRTALAVTLKLGRFAPRPGADERHDG